MALPMAARSLAVNCLPSRSKHFLPNYLLRGRTHWPRARGRSTQGLAAGPAIAPLSDSSLTRSTGCPPLRRSRPLRRCRVPRDRRWPADRSADARSGPLGLHTQSNTTRTGSASAWGRSASDDARRCELLPRGSTLQRSRLQHRKCIAPSRGQYIQLPEREAARPSPDSNPRHAKIMTQTHLAARALDFSTPLAHAAQNSQRSRWRRRAGRCASRRADRRRAALEAAVARVSARAS